MSGPPQGAGTEPGSSSAGSTLAAVRRFVIALFAIGVLGTAADLLLTGHIDGAWQLAPLILLAATTLTLALTVARPTRNAMRFHQALMVLFIVSGLVGTFLHLKANIEFELEMYPGLAGLSLFWKSIQGASPPALAPGAMIALGLLGLIYTYRHPALANSTSDRTGATT